MKWHHLRKEGLDRVIRRDNQAISTQTAKDGFRSYIYFDGPLVISSD